MRDAPHPGLVAHHVDAVPGRPCCRLSSARWWPAVGAFAGRGPTARWRAKTAAAPKTRSAAWSARSAFAHFLELPALIVIQDFRQLRVDVFLKGVDLRFLLGRK